MARNRRNNRNGARDDEEDRADPLLGARVAQYAPPCQEDSWNLQASDNPGMQLVSVKLEGNNFNTWCRSIKIALGAKVKLGFIDGRTRAPALDLENYDEWKKTDCMVISWILNSISKELVESFVYMDSAKQLWDVLCEKCDNKAAIHISENPVFHERTKHLDIDCHLVRSKFKEGFVLPQHIYSSQQLADIFTKVVSGPLFRSLQRKLGLIEGVQFEEGVLK